MSPSARFRFFGALNDFLPAKQQNAEITLHFQDNQSVKHLFESCGVPHVEVARVIVNNTLVSPKYIAQDGDIFAIHPYSLPLAKTGPARFVLDNHLGKLAAYLRLLGIDTAYRNDYQDDELAQVSSQQERILLTRDRRLLMRSIISQGYCVRSKQPRQQVHEILTRFGLLDDLAPFGRCVHCNALLEPVPKEAVLERLEPLTRLYFNEFQRCPACNQVYWKGSHYVHIQEYIEKLCASSNIPQ